jgi:UDP-N-acetylmuramoyl-L-alanyl-D-glutamate--2,6-diaminopimelate ligase
MPSARGELPSGECLMMRLHQLLRNQSIDLGGLPDLQISALTADSRQVTPGAMFVAIRGGMVDGHRFIADAIKRGAAVVVVERADPEPGVPYIRVDDSRLALAQLAAAWHGYPAQKLVMIGVTGTDGKTTTVSLLHHILSEAGLKTGMITSVSAVIGDEARDTGLHVTTPDSLAVQGYLAQMVGAGMTHCILETTSHGLAQHRVAACDFDLAVVTNITHEHLDYHGSYDGYREAKATLFRGLGESADKQGGPEKAAVLNRDDSSYAFLTEITPVRQITYGSGVECDVRAGEIRSSASGLAFKVDGRGYSLPLHSRLIGEYNVQNCLAAFSAAVEGLQLTPEVAARGVAKLTDVPGRMEIIDLGQPFLAIVDFAHTPNALRRALETARRITEGRVIAVFGSAGLRDREKRRLMAEISAEGADLTVLTAEDPRTESLGDILEEMAAGAEAKGGQRERTFWCIPDRGDALRFAVDRALPGDLVIACGKGHEQSMCFGEQEFPWDDRTALRAALAEHLGVPGPSMPFLPTSKPS